MIADKAFDLSIDSRKVYISDIPIKGKSFIKVFLDSVGEGSWSIIDESLYQIIDDSVVFSTAPTGVYLVLQVATTPTELTNTPNDATLILALKDDIKAITSNISNIVAVSDNIYEILLADTKADEASASALSASNSADEASASALSASNSADEASASALSASSTADKAEAFANSINPDNFVHKAGDESIADVKTFLDNTIFNKDIGIGTIPSAWDLNISAVDIGLSGCLYGINSGDGVFFGSNYYSNNNDGLGALYKSAYPATAYRQGDGVHKWYVTPSGTADTPITWKEAMKLDNSGNVLVTGSGGLGYGTGSGGTVTQTTNKGTSVTLNKPCGSITMNSASLASNATVSFAVNNSLFSLNDTVLVTLRGGYGGFGSYQVWTAGNTSGQFYINIRNNTAGALAEGIVLEFAIIKGSTN